MKLYHDTEKELTLCDYSPLPKLSINTDPEELNELSDNLYCALENSYIFHAELLTTALYQDIRKVELYQKIQEKRKERRENNVK